MTRRPCAEALHNYGRSLNVKALTAELARIDDERAEMLAKLKKVRDWLLRLKTQSEQQAKTNTRFPSLAEACAADADNYRKTAASIEATIAKAEGRAP